MLLLLVYRVCTVVETSLSYYPLKRLTPDYPGNLAELGHLNFGKYSELVNWTRLNLQKFT